MVAGHGAYGTVRYFINFAKHDYEVFILFNTSVQCLCYSSAFDKHLQREVAIKKLDRPFENAEFAKRTYRELAILAQMDHENVSLLFPSHWFLIALSNGHHLLLFVKVICLIDAFTPQTSLETFEDVYVPPQFPTFFPFCFFLF